MTKKRANKGKTSTRSKNIEYKALSCCKAQMQLVKLAGTGLTGMFYYCHTCSRKEPVKQVHTILKTEKAMKK